MFSGSKNNNKIKIAFLDIGSEKWTGGMYYYRNLFFAISSLEGHPIHPFIFVGRNTDKKLLEPLKPFASIIQSSLFDKNSLLRNFARLIYLITGSNILRNNFLKKHDIQIISHSNIIERKSPFKTINWIPDFQYKHLPAMFSNKEIRARSRLVKKIIARSDTIIVSSNDALRDLQTYTSLIPTIPQTKILNFVANIELKSSNSDIQTFKRIRKKYKLGEKFFFLPNQFWKHKNHQVVLEAVQILKASGINITVLCSGYMNDHRNTDHIDQLKDYIRQYNLRTNINFLGLIEREELITLMRFSLAIINPSLFEGWSSTVEEAKSIGKNLILSDLKVHREQNPPYSSYFDPHNPKELATILRDFWLKKDTVPNYQLEIIAQKKLETRIKNFGKSYLNIATKCLETSK